jgi:Glu-tRNA(Gln) amidotransferase subunit E-like FAD-binding protein
MGKNGGSEGRSPPDFFKTQVGKFTLLLVASLLVAGLYPLYLSFALSQLEEDHAALRVQKEAIKKSSAHLQRELSKIKEDVKTALHVKQEQTKSLENISSSIDELHEIKLSPKTYADFIADVNVLLKQYALMVRSIEQKGAHKMVIEVVANETQRDSIAKFMEALIAEGFVGVSTDEVRSDKSLYISKIEIAR